MMDFVGIICEYNPFHNGHAAHIEKARALIGGETAVVCVMSGNFVQRGEPAVFRKHARAAAAVKCGADLVIELPLPWAAASAGRFAFGGVSLLASLGVPVTLSFGSECGDAETLEKIARALASPETNALIRSYLEQGLPYASAQQKAADDLLGSAAGALGKPNNLLGIEYIKAAHALGADISPVTFTRFVTAHDSPSASQGFASASFLRASILAGGTADGFVPPAAAEIYSEEISAGRAPVLLPEDQVLYRLRTMTDGEYSSLPDGSEGLWKRLAKYGRTEPTLAGVLEKTKTKRYALSRIRRMALAAYLGVTSVMQNGAPPYIRILAIGPRGREALREIKDTALIPVITKPAAAKKLPGEARAVFELEARATDIYALSFPGSPRSGGGEWTTDPVVL